ncbi:hypothetical protein KBD61_06330 [Patescibacteria group bacterium]|nr:hypothetical protein [Patescibacteria group bacterium]MBP9710604.1 hypothetical protein [Patescibacteria group bacterium]
MINWNSFFLMHLTRALKMSHRIVLVTEEVPDSDRQEVKRIRGKGACKGYSTKEGFDTAFSCGDVRPTTDISKETKAEEILRHIEKDLNGASAHVVICAPNTVLNEILTIILRELLPDKNAQTTPIQENDFAILRIEEGQLLMDHPEEVSAAA